MARVLAVEEEWVAGKTYPSKHHPFGASPVHYRERIGRVDSYLRKVVKRNYDLEHQGYSGC